MSTLSIVICPGCGEDVPRNNTGCQNCGYENNEEGRLLTLEELLAKPNYPKHGSLRMNDVCSKFLAKLVEAAKAECVAECIKVCGELAFELEHPAASDRRDHATLKEKAQTVRVLAGRIRYGISTTGGV